MVAVLDEFVIREAVLVHLSTLLAEFSFGALALRLGGSKLRLLFSLRGPLLTSRRFLAQLSGAALTPLLEFTLAAATGGRTHHDQRDHQYDNNYDHCNGS